VTVTGKGNKYAQVKAGDSTGYVQAKYLTTTRPVSSGNPNAEPPKTDGSQFGLDISHYQGTVNFTALKQDGNSFIIAKATEGQTGKDEQFENNAISAKNAGLAVHAYHFFRAANEADARIEANHFADVVRSANGKGANIQYLFIDVETKNGIEDDLKRNLTNNVLAFIDQMRKNGFNKLGIYANLSYFNNNLDLSAIKQAQAGQPKFLVWLARYRGDDTHLGHGVDFEVDIWQYTDNGASSGVGGAVDKDIWYYVMNGI
jgi:GH25 family lysozyme M1 (1,4-beta-N-acetylmuramidase)